MSGRARSVGRAKTDAIYLGSPRQICNHGMGLMKV